MRKIWIFLIAVGLLISLVIRADKNKYLSAISNTTKPIVLKEQYWLVSQSKAKLVSLVKQNVIQIHELERTLGKTGPQGYKVYTDIESKQLLNRYQRLSLLLHYLNEGNAKIKKNRWADYELLEMNNRPYKSEQVFQAMSALMQNKVPKSFVEGLRIFILPYAIPDVSGLGGPGYILLSAQNTKEVLIDNQLPVTLDHEIGHHVNFTFMPKGKSRGEVLWAKFLKIRGGSWHGPGIVNTKAWGSSSEETFAEDFRMLFGKDQPYFGDLALGDPRSDPSKAEQERRFLTNLAEEKREIGYHSPWIPLESLKFWEIQGSLLVYGWLLLGLSITAIRVFGYNLTRLPHLKPLVISK